MRVISPLERKIIDRICEGHAHISTILTDHIPDLILSIDRDVSLAELLIEQSNEKQQLETATEQTKKIIYIIKFILYLEKEGYAISAYLAHGRAIRGKMGTSETLKKYGSKSNGYINWRFTDERMVDFIFKYSDLTIFPIHQLKSFKDNGYKTTEAIRHRRTVRIAITAICVSLTLGIVAATIALTRNNPTKGQFNEIHGTLKEIRQQLLNQPSKGQVDSLIHLMNNPAVSHKAKPSTP